MLYGETRREVGEALRALTELVDRVEMVEGSAYPNHIHMCPRTVLKHSVSNVVGKLKRKGSLIPSEQHSQWRGVIGRDRTLWARGYYASTAGLNESAIRKYIRC